MTCYICLNFCLICRCSTAKAFLRPARSRPNLDIALNSQVLKILVDSKTRAAYGVRVRRGEAVYSVLARKEVILSAGTLNSPQLLMLSGIGPADHLAEMGIPLHSNLPVGQNMQDHYGTGALTFTLDQPVSFVQTRVENMPSVLKYAVFGTGPLTVLGGVEVAIIEI
jgi:choline dehydrogenase-like flavoprotein